MDPRPTDPSELTNPADHSGPAHAVLTTVHCTWHASTSVGPETVEALVLHAGRDMLVLEAAPADGVLPPLGTTLEIVDDRQQRVGRVAELGRGGRFLVSLGERPVRGSLRLRVSLPAPLRGRDVKEPRAVELIDLTTGGARVRGVELPVGSQVTLDFTPPGREQPVTVRAVVAHGTHGATQPWIGVTFRLVALRGGR
jgi:PilZ domain-containing protein